jgi:hypothetical protein
MLFLHKVRLPDGVVDECKVCKAPIPYAGCCGKCTEYRLDVPREEYWTSIDTDNVEGADSGVQRVRMKRRRQ